jgi:hypothetical protein
MEKASEPPSIGGIKLNPHDLFILDINTKELIRVNAVQRTFKKIKMYTNFVLCMDASWTVIDLEMIFYCGGGIYEAPEDMNTAFQFQPTDNEDHYAVEELRRMEMKRYNHGIVHSDGFVFVLGGMDEYGVKTCGFECYGLDYKEWVTLPDLPKPMERPVASALKDTVYFTDHSTRSIFTYSMTASHFGRLPFITLEECTGKALIIKKTGTILILSNKNLYKIKNGKT